jgi:hypothetical protein
VTPREAADELTRLTEELGLPDLTPQEVIAACREARHELAAAAALPGSHGPDDCCTRCANGYHCGSCNCCKRRAMTIDVPDFADGAVAELHHGADGTVIAEVRIPGPADEQA